MDEYVYAVDACTECGSQVESGTCERCGGTESQRVRFRVARNAVIKQIQPRTFVVENALYFGCWREPGHYYFRRGMRKLGRSDAERAATPWGYKVDGGLIPKDMPLRQGEAHIVHKDGWTALAFTDRSVDSRPGSWSVFCLHDILEGHDALDIAREAFPEVFARFEFPVIVA